MLARLMGNDVNGFRYRGTAFATTIVNHILLKLQMTPINCLGNQYSISSVIRVLKVSSLENFTEQQIDNTPILQNLINRRN